MRRGGQAAGRGTMSLVVHRFAPWLLVAVTLSACGSSRSAGTSDASGSPASSASSSSGGGSGDDASLLDAAGSIDAASSSEGGVGDGSPSTPDATSGRDGSADASTAADAGHLMPVYVTFYGWADNSPPGGAIAYPKIHATAGGTGTYADPITFATDQAEIPAGTILYVPFIEKYVVMEDDCTECDSDWTTLRKWHIDIWMNSSAAESSSALIACEDHWTQTSADVEMSPPSTRTVTTPPLFDPSTNVCRSTP
jgi:3D (Asp-Asp-Asp) domain-containing protein